MEIGVGLKFGYGIAIGGSVEFPLSRLSGEGDRG